MAELTISSDEIRGALERYVSSYTPEVSREEVGIVSDAGDGIAHVEGLPSTMANELLEFADGTLGVALNLDVREIGVVVLGEFTGIDEGQQVKRTGRVLSVPVGDAFLGRVVDPLGRPIDDRGEIENEGFRELELQAPNVMARQPVKQPLQTGIKAIDAMTPIGRGPAAADHRRPQDRQDHGRDRHDHQPARQLEVRRPEEAGALHLRRHRPEGVHDRAIRARSRGRARWSTRRSSAAPASDPAGFKYLRPYTGSAIGQHWMYAGKHVLIVFDDLTKQAEAYRAVSLLLRRPPGREAYPGDVFYLHSRLLERCAKLSDELGGGSMTGLPIIETKANDISAYIPTNVISITDGQIFLESTCSTPACGRPSTSAPRCPGSAATRRSRHEDGVRPAPPRPGPVP
jgi:F-type H+-transporting ATPase subunit alpha